MRLEPLFDNVVLEPVAPQTKRDSGLFLPEDSKATRPNEGIVKAVGPGKTPANLFRRVEHHHGGQVGTFYEPVESDAPPIAPGDRVLFRAYTGAQVTVDGTVEILCSFKDIIALVHDAPAPVADDVPVMTADLVNARIVSDVGDAAAAPLDFLNPFGGLR